MSDKVTFSEAVNTNQLETPKSSQGIFVLPCGYVDSTGTLHSEVHLREMSGYEEDLLASAKIPVQKKISMLLANCLESVGDIKDKTQFPSIIANLPIGDRVFLLLALRRTSLGDDFPVEETCPSCNTKGNFILNLGDLEAKPMPDPKQRVFDAQLPSGRSVRFHIGTATDEDRVSRVPDDEKPSMMLLARTDLLDGKVPTIQDIKRLSFRDRQTLRALMDERDGGVDTSLDMTCPACGHEFKRELDLGQPGFFFPERVLKASKAKFSS